MSIFKKSFTEFEKSKASETQFALLEYNLRFLLEEECEFEKAYEHYIRASEYENKALYKLHSFKHIYYMFYKS